MVVVNYKSAGNKGEAWFAYYKWHAGICSLDEIEVQTVRCADVFDDVVP